MPDDKAETFLTKQKEFDLLLKGIEETSKKPADPFVTIDTRPILGSSGREHQVRCEDVTGALRDLLNKVWPLIESADIPAFTYGTKWLLRGPEEKEIPMAPLPEGAARFHHQSHYDDARTLAEVGIELGMRLEVIPIGEDSDEGA